MPVSVFLQHVFFIKYVPLDWLIAQPRSGRQHSGLVEPQNAILIAIQPLGKKAAEVSLSDKVYFMRPEQILLHYRIKPAEVMVFTHNEANPPQGFELSASED